MPTWDKQPKIILTRSARLCVLPALLYSTVHPKLIGTVLAPTITV